jgi:hypothetical protein
MKIKKFLKLGHLSLTMSRNLGGQKRTSLCPCGWVTKGSVRESTFKFKLHAKKCEIAKENGVEQLLGEPFDADTNGMNGIMTSRNGNLYHKPSTPTHYVGNEEFGTMTVEQVRVIAEFLKSLK